MRYLLFIFFTFLFSQLSAEFINIGVLRSHSIQQFDFHPRAGKYVLFTERGKIKEINNQSIVQVSVKEGKVLVQENGKNLGVFSKVNLIGTGWYNHFKLLTASGKKIDRRFDDNLKISVRAGKLMLINNINLDNYVAGVVEAEVGRRPPKEYFKLQAIICRTYALSNTHKHLDEGFNLCDEVHCQAYHGKSFYSNIVEASMQTKGAVIVDSDIQLITAAFHSSCGGQTVNSEDVWTKSLYYLRSIRDTFCLNKKNAEWEKEIDSSRWHNYLSRLVVSNNDSLLHNYNNELREVYFPHSASRLSFEDIRHQFRLRSAYFNVHHKPGRIVLKGRGYGHGVGLCQIGAMEMAAQGKSYSDILHFYYRGVHIIDLSALDFFKEE